MFGVVLTHLGLCSKPREQKGGVGEHWGDWLCIRGFVGLCELRDL